MQVKSEIKSKFLTLSASADKTTNRNNHAHFSYFNNYYTVLLLRAIKINCL